MLLFAVVAANLSTNLASQTNQPLQYTVSWVGNTYGGGDHWVQHNVSDIFTTSTGYTYTNVGWEEAGGNVAEYLDGKHLKVAGHTHGWGYEGGDAVAANSKYLFIAQNVDNEGGGLQGDSWPAKGFRWTGVSRRLRSNIREGAPFKASKSGHGDVIQNSFLTVDNIPDGKKGTIRALAANESLLFIGSTFDDFVRVYDVTSMQKVREFVVPGLDRIAIDTSESIWISIKPRGANQPWRIERLSISGQRQGPPITLAKGTIPKDLAISKSFWGLKDCLLLSDGGQDNNVKVFANVSTRPTLARTFGVKGGIFANPAGVFGPKRFNRPTGIGVDSRQNLIVASSGSVNGSGTVLEGYSSTGKLQWRRLGLHFVDLPDVRQAPEETLSIYTVEERYALNLNQGPGQEWAPRGHTINPNKYKNDPRLFLGGTNALVRDIDGKPFLFVTDMTQEYLHVYRFSESDVETAIPCALFARRKMDRPDKYPPYQPDASAWIWIDRDADGEFDEDEYLVDSGDPGGPWQPDERGALWQGRGRTVRNLLAPMLRSGVPQFNFSTAKTYPIPAGLDETRRLKYVASTDEMLFGGNRGTDRNQHWKPMGPVLRRYRNYTTSAPQLVADVTLPYESNSVGHESVEPISFDVAGDYVFVAYTRGLRSENLKNAFVRVLRKADLAFVGTLTTDQSLGDIGLLDLMESVRAVKTTKGEYLIFLEDDYKSKTVMFRWIPTKR